MVYSGHGVQWISNLAIRLDVSTRPDPRRSSTGNTSMNETSEGACLAQCFANISLELFLGHMPVDRA